MAEIGWPNAVSPGLAPFLVDVPDDWTATETPGALLAFIAPERDGFRANVVVFGERLPADVGVAEVAEAAIAGGATASGSERQSSPAELAIAVRRTSRVAEGRTIDQLAVATEAEDRSPSGLRSVFTLVGTFLADRQEDDEPVLKAIVSSFTLAAGR